MARIVVCGDVCPIGRNAKPLAQGSHMDVFGDVNSIFEGADLVLANLECPLTRDGRAGIKSGPVLRASDKCARGLAAAGFHALGLANNHCLDYGWAGLSHTIEACQMVGLETFGAGSILTAAAAPLVKDLGGVRLSVVGVAENERCLASDVEPGANPASPIHAARILARCRANSDIVIVLVHGGNEGYRYPSPGLRQYCRFLVEQGADCVFCQHSHCIGCRETYQAKTIIYGQGNCLFDYDGHGRAGQEGLLGIVTVESGEHPCVEWVPITQCANGVGIRLAQAAHAARMLEEFDKRSADIEVGGFLEQQWLAYCRERKVLYMNALMGYGRVRRRLNRKGLLLRTTLGREALLRIENRIACEAHREVLLTILNQLVDERSPRFVGGVECS